MARKAVTKKPAKQKFAATRSVRAAKKSVKPLRTPVPASDLHHRLEALLRTMRCIAQHEDELCTLLHDARKTNRMSAGLLRELRTALYELPAEEYVFDLRAVQQTLSATQVKINYTQVRDPG